MFIPNYVGDCLGTAKMHTVNNVQEVVQARHGNMGMRWEPGLHRPYLDRNGRPAVTINTGRTTLVKGEQVPIKEHVLVRDLINNYGIFNPIYNATMLPKESWIMLDTEIHKAARYELRAYSDIAAANTLSGFNGMAKPILEYETMNDPGEAQVDMDGLTEGRNFAPQFAGQGLPLPITHSDFWISSRTQAASAGSSMPISTANGEAAGRRVAENLEGTTIGTKTGIVYGGVNTALSYTNTSAVYGMTTFPQRLTRTTLRRPDVGTWTPAQTLADVLACLDQLKLNKFRGPFMIYHSNDWDQYLDNDYILSASAGVATQTLRQRLYAIGRETDNGAAPESRATIMGVRRLDLLFGTQLETNPASSSYRGPGTDVDATPKAFRLIFVQMTKDVCRAVNGMGLTTLQWESVGGMRLNFKVMTIQAPQFFADQYGNCGLLDATNS